MLPPNFDADELQGINQAYAGQVLLLDTCLGALLEDLDETGLATQSLLAMLSPRGFPLGEHGRIGPCDDALYGPLVHVPWMIRFPDGLGAGVRTQSLVEPADLWATLLDWHAVPGRPESPSGRSLLDTVRDERTPVHDRLYIVGQPPEQAIRTPAWYLRMAAEPALYAKPDDRWEMNNVVDRCRDVVELLQQTAQRYREALVAGRTADLAPLEDVLMRGMG
jgi:arylsulfatase A-like enzyme